MNIRDQFDVELKFPDRQYPGLEGKIHSICERFGVQAEDSSAQSVVFKGVSGRHRESFASAMERHFTNPAYVYQVVDPNKPAPLL